MIKEAAIADFSERLRHLFESGPRSAADWADELLSLAKEHPLRCEWCDDACRVQGTGNGSQEMIAVPFPKSVFRAVLARVAALCNEQTPNSVSPYGGDTVLRDDSQPTSAICVSFTNTPAEQRLELMPSRDDQ